MTETVHRIVRPVYLFRYLFLISILLFTLSLSAYGQNREESHGLVLDAEQPLEYDDRNQTIIAQGKAMLQGDGILLIAERISWDRLNAIIQAETDVTLGVTGYRLLAENLVLDLKTGTFTADGVKTGIYPWVIDAEQLIATDSNYTFSNANFKHENHQSLSPNLEITEATYDENSSIIRSKGIGLKIGNTLIGKLPSIKHEVGKVESRYELLGGEEQPLGWYTGIRFDLHRGQKIESEIKAVSYFDRGIYFRPQFSYTQADNEELGTPYQNWNVTLAGIQDDGSIGTDRRGLTIDRERGYLQVFGINRWDEKWRSALEINAFSDSEVYRDYDRKGFESNQWQNNAFEIAYDGNDLSVSVATRWQGNEYASQVETSPNILFTYGPKSLWSQWLHDTIHVEYSKMNKRDSLGVKRESYSKLDLGYKTQSTLYLARGVTYIPSLSFRWQSYAKDNGGNPTRSFWETGNEVRYSAHADYQWDNKIWKVDSLRHVMTFSLKHCHTHALKIAQTGTIPIIEPYIENPNLGPIELLDYIESDNLSPYEVIRAGWEHELLAQKNGSFKKWLDLQLYQDIWVDNKSEISPNPYFYSQARAFPVRWISFDLQAKINTESGILKRSSYGVRLIDGKVNDLSVRYLSYDSANDNLQSQITHHVDDSVTVTGAVRYDPETNTIPFWSSTLSVRKPIGWEWTIYLAQRRGTLKENDLNWGMGVNLFSF